MASVATAGDVELRKAFTELQMQVLSTREKVRQIEEEMARSERATMAITITRKTVEGLAPQHKTYVGVGRAFVLKPRDQIDRRLADMLEANRDKVNQLEKSKQYQEGKVKETENNIREMLAHRKNANQAK